MSESDTVPKSGTRAQVVMWAFALETLLAGANGVAIRFSNRELAPIWGAGLRFALASVLIVLVMLAFRQRLPRGKALAGAMLFGLFQFAGAFGFAYYALVEIQAGLGQTLLALVLVRRLPPMQPVALNAVGMVTGTAVMLGISLPLGESWTLPEHGETWVALLYFAAIGSVVVFLLHVFIAQNWGASRVAYVMVLIPLVTIILSAWLDQEPITGGLLVGGTLVVAGVYLGALRNTPTA